MSAGSRWNLAAELSTTCAELQRQVSSRSGKNLTDPHMVKALAAVEGALAILGDAVAVLTTAGPDEGSDDG